MCQLNYINDTEREYSQKYKGIYSPEEIRLNKQLYLECSKDKIDYTDIEKLLKQGADPLGGTAISGVGLFDHIYGDIVCESQGNNSINLPRITELFLKYGMNIDNPRIPYDDNDSLNPLWDFTFASNENSIIALKMLLDNGLSASSFTEFVDHSLLDFFHCECGDPENDEFWNRECIWTFKMLLLGASYDHILDGEPGIEELICCSYNKGEPKIFRQWDDFEYHFDTSPCVKGPELYGSIVHIYSKKTGEEVWKIGVGQSGRESLLRTL